MSTRPCRCLLFCGVAAKSNYESEVNKTMSMPQRNSEVVCQEVTDAVLASQDLTDYMREALEDGVIDANETAGIIHRKNVLDRELQEALLIAEETDYIEAEYEFKKRHRLGAEPHQYLRAKREGVLSLSGYRNGNGRGTNGKTHLAAGQQAVKQQA